MHAVSFGVQTDHIRQPLNNHTRPFYLPEFLSKVQNTASSLSGRHDPARGTVFVRIKLATQVTLRKIVPSKHQPKSERILVFR